MSITDKKGINVTSGFKLISPQPIDARMVVEDENELVSIVDSAAAYEGQLVYVKSLDKYVSFDGTQFNELETGGGGAYVEGETLYLNAAESGSSSGSTGGGGGGGSGITSITLNFNPTDYPLPTTEGDYTIVIQSQDIIAQLNSIYQDIKDNKIIPQTYIAKLSASDSSMSANIGEGGIVETTFNEENQVIYIFAFTLITGVTHISNEITVGFSPQTNNEWVVDCTNNTNFFNYIKAAYTMPNTSNARISITFAEL